MKFPKAAALPLVALFATVSPIALAAQEPGVAVAPLLAPASSAAAGEGVTVRLKGGRPGGAEAVDEALLRYLASQGDRVAVDAEMARLKAAYPEWKPPTDLFGGAPAVDEGPLWQLYEKGDYQVVRKRINALRAERPDWTPPQKLLDLIDVNDARAKTQLSAEHGDWADVVATLEALPKSTTCDNIDNLWRLAEGQQRTGDGNAAMTTYSRIITTCPNADHRFTTLQKAKLLVSAENLDRLVALEQVRSDTPDRRIQLAELTAKPAAVSKSPAKAAKPMGPDLSPIYRPTATIADAEKLAPAVIQRRDGVAARKIGWIYQAAGDTEAALPWFQRGLEWAPGVESARGLTMALSALGQTAQLEALGEKYPAIVTEALGGQVAVAMDKGDLSTVLRLTRKTDKSADLLLRSWALMRLMRPTEAQQAFQDVMRVRDAAPEQRDEAVYGMVRAQIAQHLFRDAANTVERYGLPPDRLNEVRADLLAQQIQVAFGREEYRLAVAMLEMRRDYASPDRGLEIQEAWCRYHIGEIKTAERMFTRLDRIVSTKDSEAGLKAVRNRLEPGAG